MDQPSTTQLGHSMLCPQMIGREQIVNVLWQLFEQSSRKRGQIALVSGEAGIGKSRLLQEFRARLPAVSRATVIQCGCFEMDMAQPYTPLVTLLHLLLSLTQTVFTSAHAAELKRLIEGFTGVPAAISNEQEQQRLLQSLTQSFEQIAQTQPLAILVEDIHWCDAATLDYFTYLAQHLANQAIFLLLSWRNEALTPQLIACIATIERTRVATEFNLTPLTLGELESMLGLIFKRPHAFRADFLDALHALTEGNPFFTEEVLRSLVAVGDIFVANGDWTRKPLAQLHIPRTVQAAVQQRTATLTPAAQQLLVVAAVIGQRFGFSLLQHLAQRNERDLLLLLRELIDGQLVVESTGDSFAFRHELTRQAVYSPLLARERRLLHREVIAAIHHVYGEGVEESLLSELAYHCYQGELWQEAMRYAMIAGERSQRLYAPVSAIEHYTHAILSARHLHITPPTTLHQARGTMFEMLGGFDAARGDFEQAVEIARKGGDLRAETQGLLDLGFLWTGKDYEKAGTYFQEAVTVARTLDDPAILANTLNRIGLWQTHAERPFDGLEYHQEALSLYEQLEDTRGIAETLDLLGVTAFMSGDMVTGWQYLQRAIAFSRATGNRAQLATNLLTAALRGGAFLIDTMVWVPATVDECVGQCEEAIQIAREIHWPATEAYALLMMGHILGVRGELPRALEAAQAALNIAKEIDHRMWYLNGAAILGLLLLESFDLDAAQHYLEEAHEQSEGLHSIYMQAKLASELSRVYLAQNKVDATARLLREIIRDDLPKRTLAQRLAWTAQVELLLAQERPAEALTIVDELVASASNLTAKTVIPRLWYLRGRALAALQRYNEAERTLQAGIAGAHQLGEPLNRKRMLVELGRLYLKTGKRSEAHDAFTQARAIIDEIASHFPIKSEPEESRGEEDERERFYRRAIAELPQGAILSPQKATQRIFDGLTQREREVAVLIAEGKSNRAIADTLTLSERTVEKHVEKYHGKAGCEQPFAGRSMGSPKAIGQESVGLYPGATIWVARKVGTEPATRYVLSPMSRSPLDAIVWL